MKNTSLQVSLEFMDAFRKFKTKLEKRVEADGITFQQLVVLYFLYKEGTVVMGAVAKRMRCDASNVTGIVDRLVQRGLVDRTESQEDRRVKELTLTADGQVFVEKILIDIPQTLGLDALSSRERDSLHAAFVSINAN